MKNKIIEKAIKDYKDKTNPNNVVKKLFELKELSSDKLDLTDEISSFKEKTEKNIIKYADCVSINPTITIQTNKDSDGSTDNDSVLHLKAVINSCNYLDSHGDVHLPGCWDEDLKSNNTRKLLKEHKREFESVISDDMKASVQEIEELGGVQCLVFEGNIHKEDNPLMFSKYKQKKVNQHSVGMRYLKTLFCVNSDEPEYSQYKENWDKYSSSVKNLKKDTKYFTAVLKCSCIEGSAVLFGSNQYTPVL
jgi:hypothetical protein